MKKKTETQTEAETETINEWKVTSERFVAFIDIMGFKDLVARSTHEQVYKMMKKLDEKKKFSENILWGSADSKLIKTTTYSDSIMIYSKDESYDSLVSIIAMISSLTHDMFIDGIPHKGALSFGTMTLDTENSIYFGQPLIDAYLLQEELNYYGVVCHATAEYQVEKYRKDKSIPFNFNYLCPFKNGSSINLTIFPMYASTNQLKDAEIKEKLFESIKELRFNTSGYLRKYIDFTEKYMREVSEHFKS